MTADLPADDGAPGALGRRGASSVAVASALAALASYGVLVVAARTLDQAGNADFLAFWALLFGLFGVLNGTQNEATRSVRSSLTTPGSRGPRVLWLNLGIGVALAAVVGATAPLWKDAVLGTVEWTTVLALCAAIVAFAGHSALAGALSGEGRWSGFAALIGLEATGRFVLVAGVALVGATTGRLAVAAAAGAVAWLVLAGVSPTVRASLRARSDVRAGLYARRAGYAMVAAASSAIIVVGFPVLLRLTTDGPVYARAAPLILAVSLTRAPLLIPLGAYQGVAITHFVSHRDDGLRSLRRVVGILGLVGAGGAVAAYAIGPALTAALFGTAYRVSGPILAGLTLAAAMLALLTLTGAATLALDLHLAYSAGWLAATSLSIVLLLLPAPIDLRTVLSLSVGPILGLVVHTVALRRAGAPAR